MAKLIFILDDEQEIEVPLPQQVTVGRQEGNDVVVDDPRISARHAVVVRDRNGNYEVRDLGSKAGTYINGVRQERRLLHPGDKLSFGPLKCVFLMEETERPMGRPRPASSGGHPVLTGILESTSLSPHAEHEGPRLTGNAFAGSMGESKGPPGAVPGPHGGSGMVVTPRLTQPHPSVSSPRSLYDEPLDKKAGSGKSSGSKGAAGVLKSILRTVGAIRHEEPAAAEPETRNTVSPRNAPQVRDDSRGGGQPVVRPGTGAGAGAREHDSHLTQRGAAQGRDITSSAVKPLAGLHKGPQPRELTQGMVDPATGEVIERVPVYTYAVQPKARHTAPPVAETRRPVEEPVRPPVHEAQQMPLPMPASSQPALKPQDPTLPAGQASMLSPLPPMPAGMVRPPLPPLPPMPASMRPAIPEIPVTPSFPVTPAASAAVTMPAPGTNSPAPGFANKQTGGFKVRISPSGGTSSGSPTLPPVMATPTVSQPAAEISVPSAAPVAKQASSTDPSPVSSPAPAPVQEAPANLANITPIVTAPPAAAVPEPKAETPPVTVAESAPLAKPEPLVAVPAAESPDAAPAPVPLTEKESPVAVQSVPQEELSIEPAAEATPDAEPPVQEPAPESRTESVTAEVSSVPATSVTPTVANESSAEPAATAEDLPTPEAGPDASVKPTGNIEPTEVQALLAPAVPPAPATAADTREEVEGAAPAVPVTDLPAKPATPDSALATTEPEVSAKDPVKVDATAEPTTPAPSPPQEISPPVAASKPAAEVSETIADSTPPKEPAVEAAGKGGEPAADQPPFIPPTMDAERAHVSQLVKELEGKQSNLMQSLRALTDRKHATQAEMERMMTEVRRSVAELEGLKTQIMARQEELRAIDRETESRHAHLTQLTAEQQRLAPITTALQQAENRHNELVLTLQALGEQRQAREGDLHRASEELQKRSEMVARLQAEEQRLAHVTAALMEGEGRYGEMVVALQALAEQHDVTHTNLKTVSDEVRVKAERISQLSAQDEWYVQSIAHRQAELAEAEQKLTQTLEGITQGVARHEELVRGLQNLDLACGNRQLELQQLADAATASTTELEGLKAKIRSVEDEVRETEGRLRTTEGHLRSLETDIQAKQQQLEGLGADEKRLHAEIESLKERELAFQGAANDAESKHAGWLTAIQGLGVQHDQKQAEIQRLHNASEAALRELEAMTSNKEQMSVHLLSLLKEQEAIDSRLTHMRKQSDDAEARVASLKALVEKREDEARDRHQVLAELETKKKGLEDRIAALSGTEEKLLAAKQQLHETVEAQKRSDEDLVAVNARLQTGRGEATELESRIRELQERLESLHVEITESRASLARDQKTHEDFQSVATEARAKQESYREALDKQLESLRADLAKESQKLAETMSQREELDRQCAELSETSAKLADTKASLQTAEGQKAELDTLTKELESKRESLDQIVAGLHGDEDSTKGRLEVLRGREKDLRQVLDELAERERNERERFEAIRRLTAEADKEHNEQRESLLAKLDGKRRELADLEMKLTPLREWKECMDIRYARLATLPEDSEAARDLWREIEGEKSNLRNLITGTPGGTRGVSLSEAVLRGLAAPNLQGVAVEGADAGEVPPSTEGAALSSRKGRFAASGKDEDLSPEERANVGNTGTGAMHSTTGQEMALKARLNRLRESVQREATRLEFLRQERAREELRTKSGSTGEPMLREQDRQLETKIRREEERLATVQRKLELAEVEEEKRRDRITEMERKLAELKSDIVDAERDRSAARHHAEIAQAEQKAQEENLKRLSDSPGAGGEETSVLASLIGGKKNRAPSNLKPMGTPKE